VHVFVKINLEISAVIIWWFLFFCNAARIIL